MKYRWIIICLSLSILTPSVCMAESRLDTDIYVQYFNELSSDEKRISELRELMNMQPDLRCYVSDVAEVIQTFYNKEYQSTAAQAMFSCVADKVNWFKLKTYFSNTYWNTILNGVLSQPRTESEDFYASHNDMNRMLDEAAYVDYLYQFNGSDKRLSEIERLTYVHPLLYVNGVQQILKTLSYDSARSQCAIMLYPYVVDKNSWEQLKTSFSSTFTWNEVYAATVKSNETVYETSSSSTVYEESYQTDNNHNTNNRQIDEEAYSEYFMNLGMDSSRILAVKNLIDTEPELYVSDLQVLLKTFDTESSRIMAAVSMYPYVVNKSKWYILENNFETRSAWENVKLQTGYTQEAFETETEATLTNQQIDEVSFANYLRSLNNNNERIEALREVIAQSPKLYVEDVQAVIATLEFDNYRALAANLMYPLVVNSGKWHELSDKFIYRTTWNEVKRSSDPEVTDIYSRQIDENVYTEYLNQLGSDEYRFEALKELIHTNPVLYVVDIQNITKTFRYDADRIKAATMLYPYVVNKGNWHKLEAYFDNSRSWLELKSATVAKPLSEFPNAYTQITLSVDLFDEDGYAQHLKAMPSDDHRIDALQELINTNPSLLCSDVKPSLDIFTSDKGRNRALEILSPYITDKENLNTLSQSSVQLSESSSVQLSESSSVQLSKSSSVQLSESSSVQLSESSSVQLSESSSVQSTLQTPPTEIHNPPFNVSSFAQTLSAQSIDTARLEKLEEFVKTQQPLKVADAETILKAFVLESYRAKAASLLYPNISDKDNWSTVSSLFSSPKHWKSIQSNTLENTETPQTISSSSNTNTNTNTNANTNANTNTNTNANSPDTPADSNDSIHALVQELESQIFDTKRQEIILNYLNHNPKLEVSNAAQILKTFSLDEDKIKPAIAIYPYIVDKNNWDSLSSSFKTETNWKIVQKHISK